MKIITLTEKQYTVLVLTLDGCRIDEEENKLNGLPFSVEKCNLLNLLLDVIKDNTEEK